MIGGQRTRAAGRGVKRGLARPATTLRRVPLFVAVLFAVIGGLLVVVVSGLVLWAVVPTTTSAANPIDLTKVALSVTAGVGGAVALVVTYRRQRDVEQGRFIERFGAAARQLGDNDVAVRIAGAYAMAGVAEEATTFQQRQQGIDVLCGYLRLPYSTALGANHRTSTTVSGTRTTDGQVTEHRHEFRQNDKEVRQTIVRIIADRLCETAATPWVSHHFDFRGAVLQDCDFSGARFLAAARFGGTRFSGDATFGDATFAQEASFADAAFTGMANFRGVKFLGVATFDRARIHGGATFGAATFNKDACFRETIFEGDAWFGESFTRAATETPATFGGSALFSGATFKGDTFFERATFRYNPHFGEGRDPRDDNRVLPAATFEKGLEIDSSFISEDSGHEHDPVTS